MWNASACTHDELRQGTALAAAGAPGVVLQPSAAGGAAVGVLTLAAVDAHGVKGSLVSQAILSDAGNGRRHLIEADWQLPPGSEQYLCARLVVPDDVYISAYYPLNPPGTHHTALTVHGKPNAPDGVTECDAGVGMKFARGSQIVLNLHLLNANDQPISGRSGAHARLRHERDLARHRAG